MFNGVLSTDRLPDPVIPPKAGIQVVWILAMTTPKLDARLRGHDA